MFAYDVAVLVFGFTFVAIFTVAAIRAVRGSIEPTTPSDTEVVFRSSNDLMRLQRIGMLFPLTLGVLYMPISAADILACHYTLIASFA